ncbi:hypothetical protein FKM82_022277 [Ascaphus truei]
MVFSLLLYALCVSGTNKTPSNDNNKPCCLLNLHTREPHPGHVAVYKATASSPFYKILVIVPPSSSLMRKAFETLESCVYSKLIVHCVTNPIMLEKVPGRYLSVA